MTSPKRKRGKEFADLTPCLRFGLVKTGSPADVRNHGPRPRPAAAALPAVAGHLPPAAIQRLADRPDGPGAVAAPQAVLGPVRPGPVRLPAVLLRAVPGGVRRRAAVGGAAAARPDPAARTDLPLPEVPRRLRRD